MLNSFSVSDGFDCEINHHHNNTKITLIDMGNWLQKLKADFPDATLKVNAKLEQLDLTYQIQSLAQAPFAPLTDLESRSERSTALLEQWSRYPTIGINVYTAFQGGFWVKAGMARLQNHGMENWQMLLSPILTTTNDILLLGERTKLAVEIADTGNGLLRPGDKLTIRGAFTCEISVWKKEQELVRQRRSGGVNLINGVATQIASLNLNRKYIYLTNTGNAPVEFIFGTVSELSQDAITEGGIIQRTNGLLLSPSGAANFKMDKFIEASPITAVAIGGNSRLTFLEGW